MLTAGAKGDVGMRVLERRFRAAAPVEAAWAHLERVESWPTWAKHIKKVELTPRGSLAVGSRGTIRLRNGIVSTFEVTQREPWVHWLWSGPFLWLRVDYDHRFERAGPGLTEIAFLVDAQGFGVSILGRLFAAIYAWNLDRAIPNLVRELEDD
jgi:hypothetical protein